MLGQTEESLLSELYRDSSPPSIRSNVPCVAIDADFDVYPNIAEPAPWWRLGNLRADGIDAVMNTYRNETAPGMKMNRTVPVSELAQKYGSPKSRKLYDKSDLIRRFMHQWGRDSLKGVI